MRAQEKLIWRSPEEIVEIAFQRARVAMMNEAHSGLQRCIRTRRFLTNLPNMEEQQADC